MKIEKGKGVYIPGWVIVSGLTSIGGIIAEIVKTACKK
jgi:hypothetical protein